jgi:hypothetical protein
MWGRGIKPLNQSLQWTPSRGLGWKRQPPVVHMHTQKRSLDARAPFRIAEGTTPSHQSHEPEGLRRGFGCTHRPITSSRDTASDTNTLHRLYLTRVEGEGKGEGEESNGPPLNARTPVQPRSP